MSAFSKVNEKAGMGNVAGNSHPVHPATVHFPISFFALSYGLDLLYAGATNATTSGLLTRLVKPFGFDLVSLLPDVTRFSHYANILGLVSSVPAVLSGSAELIAMIRSNGIWERIERKSDGAVVYGGMNPKVRHGILHALLNDVALVSSAYHWWTRRGAPDHAPTQTNLWLSMLLLPSLFISAFLGGEMVYKYGVGVQRQGEATQIKEDQQRDELKRNEGLTQVKERDQ